MTILNETKLGRYKIRSKIGKGGMGEVYLAQDSELNRNVALKVLAGDVAADQTRMNRFMQEAKAASALNHPNILTIYEIGSSHATGEGKDIHFISTEFIDGETLREHIRSAAMRLAEMLEIATQVASALSAAHAAGIVHRDIKPENIMLRRDGIVKVLDFGLAKLVEPTLPGIAGTEVPTRAAVHTEPGLVMGTVLYMSPEQARGISVDARTDIFSLGVLIYEMIAGRLPFEGSNTNEIVASILSDKEALPLARFAPEIPAELERIVSKALRKNREERYQTIKDLLLDLKNLKMELEFERKSGQKALRSDSGSAASAGTIRVSSAEYIVSGIKRHKRTVILVSAVFILGVVLFCWFLIHSPSKQTINSIAVLPFENVTHAQNMEYLSDGVTESLINSLSQLPGVKVIARDSVFRYKNQMSDLQQVARQLNVQSLLTGRVLMQGDTLDVRVELTDAQNNIQLWGDHYARKISDIFSVQDEIARQVTDTLRLRLTGGQQEQVTKRYTENAEAYRLYLQGRYFVNDFSEENLTRAIQFFDQAISIDSRYALAYAARGDTFWNMGDLSLSMKDAMAKARQDVAAALSIDDKLVEARTTLANIEFQYDWDFARAQEDYKRAIALKPNYAEAHHQYAWYLSIVGKPMEGLAEMKLAQQLDPVNPSISVDVCLPYNFARQFDQSIAASRKTLEMFPNFYIAHMALGNALFFKGDYPAGIEELQKAEALESTPHLIGNLGYAYAKAGRKDEARRLLTKLEESSKQRYVAPYWIAMIHVGLDEKDEAFNWFEKAYQERSWWLMFIKMDPMVDSLRSDPRFKDLLSRIHYPQ